MFSEHHQLHWVDEREDDADADASRHKGWPQNHQCCPQHGRPAIPLGAAV